MRRVSSEGYSKSKVKMAFVSFRVIINVLTGNNSEERFEF
jgi:hypothetical protein